MGGLREKYLDREQEKEREGLFERLSVPVYKIPSSCAWVYGASVYLGNRFPAKSGCASTLSSLPTTARSQ